MIRLLLVLSWISSWLYAASPLPERLPMDIGDAKRLRLDPKASLRLSQKHVLEVSDLGRGEFQIVALRSGVVYVRAMDEKGVVQQSWIVDVATRAESSKAGILHQARWKPLLCMEAGIRCDYESVTILGQTHSLNWLHRARDICEKHPPCRFQASLRHEDRILVAQRIARELQIGRVTVDGEGFILFEVSCLVPDTKREDQWRQWIQERYGAPLQIRCRDTHDGRYRLEVVAVAHKRNDADLNNPIQFGPIKLLPEDKIEIFLEGLSQRHDTKILARPQLAINLGSSLEISDGMEIATLAPQRDQTLEIWKAVGFMLQIKLLEQRGEAVKVAVVLQLSQPREGQRALDRSGLQTETWLTLDQLQLVGQIQAQTTGFEESRIPWLGDIPWFGALFRWNVESTADSEVYLLLRLQNLTSMVLNDRMRPEDL